MNKPKNEPSGIFASAPEKPWEQEEQKEVVVDLRNFPPIASFESVNLSLGKINEELMVKQYNLCKEIVGEIDASSILSSLKFAMKIKELISTYDALLKNYHTMNTHAIKAMNEIKKLTTENE